MRYILLISMLLILSSCEDAYKEGYYNLGPNLKCINGHVYQVIKSQKQNTNNLMPLLDSTGTHEQCPKSIKY